MPKTFKSWANIFLTMALHIVLSAIQLEDGSEAVIEVSAKAADYFGIAAVTPKMKVIEKRGYSYHRNELGSSDKGRVVRVPKSRYTRTPKVGRRDDRKIRVPRQDVSPRGNVRTFSFSFPRRAKYWEISQWLWQQCNKHKPLYFLTEAGKKRIVWDYSSEAYFYEDED